VWFWAVVLAIAWHALWWMVLSPRREPHPMKRVPAARLAFIVPDAAAAQGETSASALGIGSPVLFALPTEAGFSGAALTRELALLPPVELPEKSAMLLPFPAEPLRSMEEPEQVSWWAAVSTPLLPPRPEVFAPVDASEEAGMLVLRFAPEMNLPEQILRPDPSPGGKAWEARACLLVDELGQVQQVLLDEPAPEPEWNRHLARELRALTFDPGPAERRGEVSVYYTGAEEGS
jgi:hypothetical protein